MGRTCAKRKIYTGRTKELMIPREEFGPLEKIVVDVAYFAEFQAKYKYLLVIIDRFSKLMRLVPLIRQDGTSVSQAIKNQRIYKFGKPKAILSDREKFFEGGEMKALSAKFC